jgi:dipeptide transport system ATP-binding protein
MALIMITHDLAVVAEVAHKVAVMYAGQVAEMAKVPGISANLPIRIPRRCSSPSGTQQGRASPVHPAWHRAGQYDRPSGCLLSPRCPYVQDKCKAQRPGLTAIDGGVVRCHYPITAKEA